MVDPVEIRRQLAEVVRTLELASARPAVGGPPDADILVRRAHGTAQRLMETLERRPHPLATEPGS